jgi:calcineurin-like phosphoesterase
MENNIFKQFKIAHIADLHLNLKKSELPQQRMFQDIINTVSDRHYGIDSLIIAGDIFDVTPQTNAEVKLVYQFLVDLLNIDTLDEVVFMEGNHDLILKKSLQQEGETDITVFDTFINMLNSLNEDYSNKFIYINKSGIYQSKIHQNIKYVGYCLRDGMKLQPFDKDSNSTYIGIYHDILQEYAAEKKLPVRQDILNKKLSIDTFKNDGCDYVIAGDIHENYNYDNYFFYSGSTQQVNAGEGEYIKILKNNQIKFDETTYEKFINIYKIDTNSHKLILDKKESLINFRNYVTIDIKETYTIAEIMDMLIKNKNTIEAILPSKYNVVENTIVIKLLYYYRQVESVLTNKIQEFFKSILNNQESNIDVKYSGMQIESEEAIEKIQKVLEVIGESDSNESSINTSDSILTDELESLKPIHLTDLQIQKLFEAQIDTVNNVDLNDDIKSEIINLFKSEYRNIIDLHSNKYYDIQLLSIYTNNFMGLGENKINLDIPGLTRIKGTNGIGKTTLYNMIKYVITGNVFDGLSKNQKVKNALLLFNDSKPEIDKQIVKLKFKINHKDIEIIRTNERIWKNNVTDEQKVSINWKEYVSTVKSDVVIKSADKEITNIDVIENLLNEWFGNTINNIVILNSDKLSKILNTTGSELKDLMLYYLGINYLSLLKNNLPNVKESLNIVKPKINYTDTKIELNNFVNTVNDLKQAQLTFETDKLNYEKVIVDNEKDLERINNDLISLGYNPTVIELNKESLESLELSFIELSNYTEQKSIPEKINIDNERKLIDLDFNTIQDDYAAFQEKYQIAIEKLDVVKSDRIKEYQKSITEEYNTKIAEYENTINNIRTQINDSEKYFSNKINDTNNIISKLNTEIYYIDIEIQKIKNELDSGICQSCKRPFDVDITHTEELNQKITDLNNQKKLKQEEIDKHKLVVENLNQNKSKAISELTDIFKSTNNSLSTVKNEMNIKVLDIPKSLNEDLEVKYQKLSEIKETKKSDYNKAIKDKDEKISVLISKERKNSEEIQEAINHNNMYEKRIDLLMRIESMKKEIEAAERLRDKFENYTSKKKIYQEELQKNKFELQQLLEKYEKSKTNLLYNQNKVEQLNQLLKEYDEYKRKNTVFTIYKALVEDKFPEAIFLYYQQFINNVLNELLEDMPFKLYWHSSGDLYMTVIENGNIVYRPVLLSSGMQNAFLGLSLVYAIHELNIKNNISHIFIDEISGQLNSGKELSNQQDVINYQSELSNLLSKFRNKSIFIVDHVIDNLFETFSYEVIKDSSTNTAKYIS